MQLSGPRSRMGCEVVGSCLLSGVGSKAQGHAGGSDGFLLAALPPQEERHA